jgi:hypothetical protein
MGVDPNDFVGHKRFLAFFAGGMLPIISLSFLHMLVKFTEEDRLNENNTPPIKETESNPEDLKQFVDESVRLHLSEEDLKKLEEVLLNPPKPNEKLKEAAQRYSDEVREKHTHIDDFEETSVKSELTPEERGEILAEMMKNDQELGLYDEPYDNPMIKDDDSYDVENGTEQLNEWDATLMDGLEDEEPFYTEEEIEKILQEEPTEEEIEGNFSTIEPISENIFQEEEFNIPVDEAIDNEPELTFEEGQLPDDMLKDLDEVQTDTFSQEPTTIEIPEDDERMNIIGQNGNEGLHYENEETTSSEQDDEKKN